MALRTRGIITQVAKEITFNTAPTFVDNDVVKTVQANVNPKVDMVERKGIACSMIKEAGLPIRYTTDGQIDLELEIMDVGTDLKGSILFEAGLGKKEEPNTDTGGLIGLQGDGTTAGNLISKPNSGVDGTATLYEVTDKDVSRISIALKKYFDSGDVVLQSTGMVISKTTLDFKQADILTASFSLEGAGFSQLAGQTVPSCSTSGVVPFVGKNGVFTYDGGTVDASNISFDITNTITNIEAITKEGYADKLIVEKEISGSFTVVFENFDYLDKLKNQTIGSIYLQVDTSAPHSIAVYAPRVKVSDVSITDDSNKLIEATIQFTVEKDSVTNTALLLASK